MPQEQLLMSCLDIHKFEGFFPFIFLSLLFFFFTEENEITKMISQAR